MKINKKIFIMCIILLSVIFIYFSQVYAEIIIYHKSVPKGEYEHFKELKPMHTIELEKSEKTFIDKVISNKWIVLFLSITIIIIFMIIIIRSAIKKRRYGR